MSEFTPKSVEDLGGPALARLRELAAQVEKAETLARSLRAEALGFVQVLDLLGVDFPEQLRVVVRAKALEEAADQFVYLVQLCEEREKMILWMSSTQ